MPAKDSNQPQYIGGERARLEALAREQREVERLAEQNLARWRAEGSSALSTLELRAAAHAAERAGDTAASRELAAVVDAREARGETS
jgi:hypothetical protein